MNLVKKGDIYISDLTHTEQGIVARVFPLGASCIYSYAKEKLGSEFNFRLFKFPKNLNDALVEKSPKVLGFSNFVWNFNISYKFSSVAKQRDPNTIIVWGGPNFPTEENEKKEFLKKWPVIDFYIELEGELGFVDLIKKLSKYNFNKSELIKNREKIANTCYLYKDDLVTGNISRIKDVNIVPSSYLNGAMDEFFNHPILPIIETTRGCPFSCAFCADGNASKNVVHRYDPQRVKDELNYIGKRVKNVNELHLADLNFGMYKQDIFTAKMIADTHETFGFPKTISAAGGKNLPHRVMEVVSLVKGWSVGASIQSTDKDVLKAIQRGNISSDAYKKLIDFCNEQDSIKTYTDIILGLPNDTKDKHFESIRFSIDNDVNSIRMHQAMMLSGSKMASESEREKYQLKTKWRTSPGTVGYYKILDKKYPIAEMDEIIISTKSLSHKDYLDCRLMNLIVETFYNNAIFFEIFGLIKSMKLDSIELLTYIKNHPELYTKKIREIFNEFISETTEDLYNTREEAQDTVLSPKMIEKYINGELGYNELLAGRDHLFNNYDDLINLLFKATNELFKEKKLLSKSVEKYLAELKVFISTQKKDPLKDIESIRSGEFTYDFKSISEMKFKVDPNSLESENPPIRFDFYYNKDQRDFITKQVEVYSKNAEGMGRMFFESDMRIFSRSFSRSKDNKSEENTGTSKEKYAKRSSFSYC